MKSTVSISVIIPVKDNDLEWQKLIQDLNHQNIKEIILVGNTPINIPKNHKLKHFKIHNSNRAKNLNYGALKAQEEFLWFLHADSRLDHNTLNYLITALEKAPHSLHYCNLDFGNSFLPMKLNMIGVWLRCKILNIPFGDQGFCINRNLFQKLNFFPETANYGEDHLFIWKLKQEKINITSIKAKLYTSPRKYQKQGWLYTTLQHQYLWLKQAIPEYIKYLSQLKSRNARQK